MRTLDDAPARIVQNAADAAAADVVALMWYLAMLASLIYARQPEPLRRSYCWIARTTDAPSAPGGMLMVTFVAGPDVVVVDVI
ncbi:MAG: hypothetical protein EBQ89_11460, partial [Alphaproteobacteria bacterium]|nr:hypothetical protein [Alphaproteobacteria bacterium]